MSARKNWSALSSLARQWTVEDEEEVERERRRRVRGSSSTADPDDDFSPDPAHPALTDTPTPRDTPTTTSNSDSSTRRGTERASSDRATGQGVSSEEQTQLDFIEMLRKRDERRRLRQMETLSRQKEEGEEEVVENGGGGGARVESLGYINKEEGKRVPPPHVPPKPTHAQTPAAPRPTSITSSTISITTSPTNSTTSSIDGDSNASTTTSTIVNRQGKRDSLGKDPDPKPPSTRSRQFVSSVSISLDKSLSSSERSGRTTPMSPCSPTASLSPREHWPSPCQSPSPRGAQSPVHNGHTQEMNVTGSPSNGVNIEQTTRPAFIKSSRTASFRLLQRKEEEKSPLQRSTSVRLASKKFESNTEQSPDENRTSPFQRNSRQRMSSKSIQEMMERLALASQKSDVTVIRSPDVTQRTLFLMDEVSRKRGLFEKDQQAAGSTRPGISRQELRGFASGMSDRINLWVNKTNQSGTSPSPTDLRNVDITTKTSLFEGREEEDNLSKNATGKI